MNNLDLLIPQAPAEQAVTKWATVTQVTPLRIQLDGETAALTLTPDNLTSWATYVVGDRVYVQISGRRLLVIGGIVTGTRKPATQGDLTAYAPLNSPTLIGTPTAPTATVSDSSTKIATTAFVQNVTALAVPTGLVLPWAGQNAASVPNGYLLADGTAVSRSTYAALFTAISTTYGAGDGSTTFNLPNLKGSVPVGYDATQTEFNAIGKSGGEKAHTLTVSEMPAHTHAGIPQVDSTQMKFGTAASGSGASTFTTQGTGSNNFSVASQGGGAAHNNLQPYIAMRFIIKT